VPEAHLEPQAALATGYGQSKWVAETLLKRTSELTGIHTVIARVGQLSGDSMSGGWTTKEWFPDHASLIASLGLHPTTHTSKPRRSLGLCLRVMILIDVCRGSRSHWVPTDIRSHRIGGDAGCAGVSTPGSVFHIAHPRPSIRGDRCFGHAGRLMRLPLVSHEEWLGR